MPRSSVTARNLFPEAAWTAVTVTPGSTPPVESVIVPVSTASCAKASIGMTSMSKAKSIRRMSSPSNVEPISWS